ncbi:RDD domain containing protein [Gloeothece citriformis PCC 7424]|uniref:RDD domain containing protein n=1 Tax=Gloeothece citriformis (strain PCC 7424) TaxID=65393 RepID=B7KEN9_GLOC7|nr:RDD family protein [Gloeothece citriformis]ACK69064.1 RDD domain containing protein [Gloeothece citriformis PCC 7424]
MYLDDPSSRRFPKVPIDRRAYAFLIDFVSVWLISSVVGAAWFLQLLVFIITWLILRVIVVEKNKGQSLGRWSLDMKIIDGRFRRIPGIVELAKREGILGLEAAIAMIGLNLAFINPLSTLLLVSPLLVDCGLAIGDEEFNQAFHDRFAGTLMIQTQRGFSLDLRLRRVWWEVKGRLKKK